MGQPENMFITSVNDISATLRQGEILSNVIQLKIKIDTISLSDLEEGSTPQYNAEHITHPYAIIITQDCDLEQDYNYRFEEKGKQRNLTPNILLCEVEEAEILLHGDRLSSIFKSSNTVRNNFIKNNDFRYHFLQSIPPEFDIQQEGLSELGIEFKRYFTMPTDEIYRRIEMQHTQRRSRLKSPYLEHFSSRYHYYHSRVALPEQYESE